MQVWFDSVGRGANLILNVAADKTGKLDPADVKSLIEFKELRDKLYAKNFALGATGPRPAKPAATTRNSLLPT